MRNEARSPYMEFAKRSSGAQFNLATSGMANLPLSDLGMSLEEVEINGDNSYGYEPLKRAIAERYRVPVECIVTTAGTSMANHLALATVADYGEEILVECPTYELIVRTAEYLGLRVKRFQRRANSDFSIDLDDLERNLTADTRAIVICNFHNPSGNLTSDEVLRQIGGLARKVGAKVIVDEVYREMLWEDRPQSAVHLDPETFLSTNSLTKAYGLSGLRCGWVLCPPEIADRMWQINDLYAATPVHPGELMSVRAFERLPQIASKQRNLLEHNRSLLKQLLDTRDDLDYYWSGQGTTIFPALRHQDKSRDFPRFFRDEFSGSVVPGHFFEVPERFRVGVGMFTEQIAPALEQFGRALDAYAARNSG
jgi:aspartate/methionine/tyrosine aminotransferase